MQKIWGLKKLIDKDISKTYIFLFGRVLKIVLVGRGGGGLVIQGWMLESF